jgi:hypothetical protein
LIFDKDGADATSVAVLFGTLGTLGEDFLRDSRKVLAEFKRRVLVAQGMAVMGGNRDGESWQQAPAALHARLSPLPYEVRFGVNFSAQDEADLVAFLSVLWGFMIKVGSRRQQRPRVPKHGHVVVLMNLCIQRRPAVTGWHEIHVGERYAVRTVTGLTVPAQRGDEPHARVGQTRQQRLEVRLAQHPQYPDAPRNGRHDQNGERNHGAGSVTYL